LKTIVIAGGGAAGFFTAINIAEKTDNARIIILEKTSHVLEKVRISGGGRCNVTHACFDPKELVKFYPRGERELLAPFMQFSPMHTIEWFAKRGVQLKQEADGRIFPTSDSSETIVNCFYRSALAAGVEICTREGLDSLKWDTHQRLWQVVTDKGRTILANAVLFCTGSAHRGWQMLAELGHQVIAPVPSLFTFHVKDERLKNLAGISIKHAVVEVASMKLKETGPLLITHWGLSGPAVLRLSAWGARKMYEAKYRFLLSVDFSGIGFQRVFDALEQFKRTHPKKSILAHPQFEIPERLWKQLLPKEMEGKYWSQVSRKSLLEMVEHLTKASFPVSGKSVFKEEFVTAGGVDLKEVDFKTMQSKIFPNLFFAGEVLNIDALTGGFNFQAAWTTAWIASEAIRDLVS
jgi:predicted Rossmann fold flavoprotein